MSSVAATLPDPHPSPANTLRSSVCGRRRRKGRGRGEDVGGHSASSLSIILFRANFRGREKREGDDGDEMFSQKDSLLPSTFPQ